jgi:MftR C-terminal domain
MRTRLLISVPELRARMLAQQGSGPEALAALLAQRRGLPRDDLAALLTAAAIDALARGLQELKP